MNNLTSQQRKLAYLIGIIALLVPITWLSQPADGLVTGNDAAKKINSGGYLSQLRTRYDLGESDLGNVDASGAAINLVLLGMRGVAVNILWMDLDLQKDMKRWAEMQATTESIVRLQPHYERVWDICGWNLAYNTSAEWDAVVDRYYWVKQGAKLLKRGVERNTGSTELHYRMGKVIQSKIGIADESVQYRHYFLHDPDPAFNGGPDPELNRDGRDNYLVAKDIYIRACVCELNRPQHILDRTLFRSSPARCQFDYATALQNDGKFGEETRAAWDLARQDWTERFGREEFHTIVRDEEADIHLEMSDEDIKRVAKDEEDEGRYRRAVDAYQKMCNYRYWRTRAYAEAEPEMAEAHRSFYEAKQAFKAQKFEEARTLAFAGMQGFHNLFTQPAYEILTDEDQLCEECMVGWKIWDDIYQLAQEKVPEEYPLKWFVDRLRSSEAFMKKVNRQFARLLRDEGK